MPVSVRYTAHTSGVSRLKIGYARVSTDAQDLTAQRDALQTRYERAVQENLAQRYNDVRTDARAVIEACAAPR